MGDDDNPLAAEAAEGTDRLGHLAADVGRLDRVVEQDVHVAPPRRQEQPERHAGKRFLERLVRDQSGHGADDAIPEQPERHHDRDDG
jgi:hypothetical protein